MMFLNSFFRRITKDFRHKELLPLKLLFFVHASTLYVLYPYLTIHMRELGINVEETAIMSAVTPILVIVMPPLAGMVADRIGNFRIMLAVCSALGGAAALFLLLVPVGRITVTYPERVSLSAGCPTGLLDLTPADSTPCSALPNLTSPLAPSVETRLEACGFACPLASHINATLLASAHNYDVGIALGPNVTDTYSYTLSPDAGPKRPPIESSRNHKMHANDHYRTSIRVLSARELFFPTTGLYNLTCDADTCTFGVENVVQQGTSTIPALRQTFKAFLRPSDMTGRFVAALGGDGRRNATCRDAQELPVSVVLGELRLDGCRPRCLVSLPRHVLCEDLSSQVELDISLTFWVYMVVRVFIGMIGGTAFAMFEGAVIAILREHNADYGLQRIYATIGGMISSPVSGVLIDWASKGKGYTDFRPAFYLYAALKIVSGLLMLTINLEFKAPATNIVRDVIAVLKNVEIVALFIVIFVLGMAWGYIESFLFWLLQDLGASRSLMGITITVGGIAGIPLLVLSGPIIERIGHANVLFIGFIFYAIRLIGYSLIYNPWLCLIFEAMESVTSSLSFTAAVTYAAKLSSTATDSSIQGILGALYFGVGKGAGSLIGGYLMKGFGTRPTYRIFAVVCLVTGVIYFLFNKFYLRKRPQVEGNDIVKKKRPAVDVMEAGDDGKKKEKAVGNNNGDIFLVENTPFNKTPAKLYTAPPDAGAVDTSAAVDCQENLAYDSDDGIGDVGPMPDDVNCAKSDNVIENTDEKVRVSRSSDDAGDEGKVKKPESRTKEEKTLETVSDNDTGKDKVV